MRNQSNFTATNVRQKESQLSNQNQENGLTDAAVVFVFLPYLWDFYPFTLGIVKTLSIFVQHVVIRYNIQDNFRLEKKSSNHADLLDI